MKILPITNHQTKNNGNTAIKQNCFSPNAKNSSANSFSFTGIIVLNGKASEINKIEFPDNLYLNPDETFNKLENENKPYRRWENFRSDLTKLFAKRCNYLGLTKNVQYGGIVSSKDSIRNSLCDSLKERTPRISEFDWTKGYEELEKLFESTAKAPFGTSDNMEEIKKELPEVLKKQGWIK